jgi:hypothetical protein
MPASAWTHWGHPQSQSEQPPGRTEDIHSLSRNSRLDALRTSTVSVETAAWTHWGHSQSQSEQPPGRTEDIHTLSRNSRLDALRTFTPSVWTAAWTHWGHPQSQSEQPVYGQRENVKRSRPNPQHKLCKHGRPRRLANNVKKILET